MFLLILFVFSYSKLMSIDDVKLHSCSRIKAHTDHYAKHIMSDSLANKKIVEDNMFIGYKQRRNGIGEFAPLKFQVFFEEGIDLESKEIIFEALNMIEQRLKVKPITNDVNLPVCPEKNSATFSFDGHVAIWVHISINDTECDESTIAYSYNCYLSPVDKRPLTGFIKTCPVWKNHNRQMRRLTILHETFHILGFAKEHFKNYPTESRVKSEISPFRFTMYPDKRATAIFRKYQRRRKGIHWGHKGKGSGVRIMKLGLQKSTELARQHFDCIELNGLELSRDVSHCSKTFFFSSFMSPQITGSSNENCLFSYTVLEESGWYIVDKSGLTLGVWMENVGCDVFTMNCLDYWKKNTDTPWFCFEPIEECAIVEWSEIPKKFIYYKSNHMLGGIFGPEMEYCGLRKSFIFKK